MMTRGRYSATWAPEICECPDSQCLPYNICIWVSWHNLLPYILYEYVGMCGACVARVCSRKRQAASWQPCWQGDYTGVTAGEGKEVSQQLICILKTPPDSWNATGCGQIWLSIAISFVSRLPFLLWLLYFLAWKWKIANLLSQVWVWNFIDCEHVC